MSWLLAHLCTRDQKVRSARPRRARRCWRHRYEPDGGARSPLIPGAPPAYGIASYDGQLQPRMVTGVLGAGGSPARAPRDRATAHVVRAQPGASPAPLGNRLSTVRTRSSGHPRAERLRRRPRRARSWWTPDTTRSISLAPRPPRRRPTSCRQTSLFAINQGDPVVANIAAPANDLHGDRPFAYEGGHYLRGPATPRGPRSKDHRPGRQRG